MARIEAVTPKIESGHSACWYPLPRQRVFPGRKLGSMFRSAGVDLAVDLGTSITRVHVAGRGVVFAEPTVAAMNVDREVVALGAEAVRLVARTQETLSLTRALTGGTIPDFDLAERVLRYAIERAQSSGRMGHGIGRGLARRMGVVLCVPATISGVERRALALVAEAVGARDVHVIEPTAAAARGIGLPLDDAVPSMIAVLGAGVTEVAVLTSGGAVAASSVRVGGDALDAAIVAWLRAKHSLIVGDRTAEGVKTSIGTAWPATEEVSVEVRGRDIASGLPQLVTVTSQEIRGAMAEPIAQIAGTVQATVNRCPPEVRAELAQHGLVLAGGGALLTGLAQRLRSDLTMPVTVADQPLEAVVLGAANTQRGAITG